MKRFIGETDAFSGIPFQDDRRASSALHLEAGQTKKRRRVKDALLKRMTGPGGLYNVGNLLGLAVGLAAQLHGQKGGTAFAALGDYFAGSGGAKALTVAVIVFFASGEAYHRAWANGSPPDDRLNRLGDLLSAVGAVFLSLALFLFGQPFLAVTAGLLLGGGKLGSALFGQSTRWWPSAWPDPFRSAVLLSRLPAMLGAGLSAAAALPLLANGAAFAFLTPMTLVVCNVLWAWADILLFAPPAKAMVQPS